MPGREDAISHLDTANSVVSWTLTWSLVIQGQDKEGMEPTFVQRTKQLCSLYYSRSGTANPEPLGDMPWP